VSGALITVARLRPIGLDELDRSVPLRVREDHKYLVPVTALDELFDALTATHHALEIDGRRAFAYDTVYFDTPELAAVRAHVQGRRQRFKCRSRLYVDTQTCAFELKLKGRRGETVKHRLPYDPSRHGTLTAEARAFATEHVRRMPDVRAVLRTTYTRITLTGPEDRVTVDLDLSYGDARLREGWAIVETKSAGGVSLADRELRRVGGSPLSLSKYLLGMGLTRMPTPPNDTRRIARRYFAHA
jgi:hypothetical protein